MSDSRLLTIYSSYRTDWHDYGRLRYCRPDRLPSNGECTYDSSSGVSDMESLQPTGIHLIFNLPLSKLYTNSLMSSLNSRAGWKYGSGIGRGLNGESSGTVTETDNAAEQAGPVEHQAEDELETEVNGHLTDDDNDSREYSPETPSNNEEDDEGST